MANPIITEHVYPPIPMRQFDWAAYRDPEGKVGWGRTEVEAITDLAQRENDGTVPDRESAWLIERRVSPPQYVASYHDLGSLTQDPWRAARFETERAAFDARLRINSDALRDECRTVEHVFINKPE